MNLSFKLVNKLVEECVPGTISVVVHNQVTKPMSLDQTVN